MSAFVNLQGRIVAVFFQKMTGPDEALLVFGRPFALRAQAHLQKYLTLAGAEFSERNELNVYFDLEGPATVPAGVVAIRLEKGAVLLSGTELPVSVTEAEFRLFRLKNNLPLQGPDYDEELLLNIDETQAVSFTKGCYLGQEIIARVHYRSHPPKKLIVTAEEDLPAAEKSRLTSKSPDPVSGKTLGFILLPNPA